MAEQYYLTSIIEKIRPSLASGLTWLGNELQSGANAIIRFIKPNFITMTWCNKKPTIQYLHKKMIADAITDQIKDPDLRLSTAKAKLS